MADITIQIEFMLAITQTAKGIVDDCNMSTVFKRVDTHILRNIRQACCSGNMDIIQLTHFFVSAQATTHGFIMKN